MHLLIRYFLQGCLVTVPLAVTAYVVYWFVTALDRLVPVGVPAVGALMSIVVVTAVGFFASSVVGGVVVRETERLMSKMPLVKVLYNSIKDLIGAFVGDKKNFDKPVMVSLVPGSPSRVLGFLTRDDLSFADGYVAVYFPQSYNFAGNLVLCRPEQITPLDVPSSDLMAFIVSGGVTPTRREAEAA
jgi:uncharacterized membrane protein